MVVPSVLLFLVLVVGGAFGIAHLLRRASRVRRPIEEVVCSSCRHDARGLADARCPECGCDLEVDGVVDRLDPRRPGLVLALRIMLALSVATITWIPAAIGLALLNPPRLQLETTIMMSRIDVAGPTTARAVAVERVSRLGRRETDAREIGRLQSIRVRGPLPDSPIFVSWTRGDVPAEVAEIERAIRASFEGRMDPALAPDPARLAVVTHWLAGDGDSSLAVDTGLYAAVPPVVAGVPSETRTEMTAANDTISQTRHVPVLAFSGATLLVVPFLALALRRARREWRAARPIPISTLDSGTRAAL